ncbi:LytR family transcriptional regulator [Bacillus sp. HMF5848]|uniref:LCP family protein n=1 Tax=Bacillus sp. HMF5848 TaxID=2495421 RepID=UPI000F7978E0|nr:LCP family protein [Bacillus sp. HMF5848]RSK26284.1 LytR family transcriptional regulator [Bacillus sp. HMF5848]
MANSRMQRKHRQRKRKKVSILTVIIVFLLAGAAYAVFEYNAGVRNATEGEDPNVAEETSTEKETEEFNGVKEQTSSKTNVLLLGVDSRGETKSRTDTIIIAQYDSKTNEVKLGSIMRDTYVSIPGYKDNKINTAFYFGGPELLRQTIKENFGIDIEYYAIVDFKGFTKVVDTISPKGIEIEVEKRMKYQDGAGTINIDLYPGVQKLNGDKLLDFARFRNDSEGDFGRVRRQQIVLSKVKDEIISINGVIKLPRLLGTIQPFVDTNMSQTKMLSLGTDYLLNPDSDIETLRIPVDNSFWNASYEHAGAVLEIDKEKNIAEISAFFNDTTEMSVDTP